MEPLRWRYKIQVDVEKTFNQTMSRGFLARRLEGQSRTKEEHFPLNQIEIEGGIFAPTTKIQVSPSTTQIYISIKDVSDIQEMERAVADLEKAEEILNDIVIFAANETRRFDIKTKIPVMSTSMLTTQYTLKKILNAIRNDFTTLFLGEISRVWFYISKGELKSAKGVLDILSDTITLITKIYIRFAKEQGIEGIETLEEELNKQDAAFISLKAELVLAKSRSEANEIVSKFWKKFASAFKIDKKTRSYYFS